MTVPAIYAGSAGDMRSMFTGEKIPMDKPVVELDGDEMTRYW